MIKVWRFARDREGRADAHKRTNCRKVAVSPPALVASDCDCDWLVRAPEGVDPLSVRFLPLLAWYGVALLYGKLFVAMVPSGFRLTCMHGGRCEKHRELHASTNATFKALWLVA